MSIEDLSDEKRHPIRVAAQRANLTPDLLRAWENRYGAVEPGRTAGGQRRYSDRDVAVLRLLSEAVDAGRRIGDVAALDIEEVEQLVREDRVLAVGRSSGPVSGEDVRPDASEILSDARAAVEAFDGERLRAILRRAAIALTPVTLSDEVLGPLMRTIGVQWERGEIDPGQEHFATAAVRQSLGDMVDRTGGDAAAPRLLAATPSGQRHEIGALLAAATAATEGWRVTYLGADLPVEAIGSAAVRGRARALAISIVHPDADGALVAALGGLVDRLGPEVKVFVGGDGSRGARRKFESVGLTWLADIASLRRALRSIDEIEGSLASGP